MTFSTFKTKGEQEQGALSFLTNLPAGSLDRLESLTEGYDSKTIFDLGSLCWSPNAFWVTGNRYSDLRQRYLSEDIFEDFEDGTLKGGVFDAAEYLTREASAVA